MRMIKNEKSTHTLTVRLEDDLFDEILNSIKKSGMSANEFVKRACREKLDNERPAAPRSWTDDELRAKIAAMEDDLEAMKLYLEATGKIPEKTGKNNPLKINAKTGENA